MIRALNFVLHRIPTSVICKFVLLPGIKLMYNNNYTSEREEKKINKLNIHFRKTKTGNEKKKVVNFASWPYFYAFSSIFSYIWGHLLVAEQFVSGDSWAHLWSTQQGQVLLSWVVLFSGEKQLEYSGSGTTRNSSQRIFYIECQHPNGFNIDFSK